MGDEIVDEVPTYRGEGQTFPGGKRREVPLGPEGVDHQVGVAPPDLRVLLAGVTEGAADSAEEDPDLIDGGVLRIAPPSALLRTSRAMWPLTRALTSISSSELPDQ